MSTPMSFAARLLGRVLNPVGAAAPALILAGGVSLAPVFVAETMASEEWRFSGWSDSAFDGAMFMGGSPPVTARDLRLYGEVLGLDEMQMEIMRDSFADFEKSYNHEWTLYAEARSDEQHAMRADGGWQEMQKRFAQVKEDFDAKVDRLEEQFISDLRLVLTAEQLEKWSALEREQRRTKTLAKYASYEDEKVDMVACVRALDLTDSELSALNPLLEEYRVQIDAALTARNRKAEELGEEYAETQQMQMDLQGETDPMLMQEGWERFRQRQQELVPMGLELRRLCARVRDVNLRFRDRLEQQLPAHQLEAFREVAMPQESGSMMFGGYSRVRMMFSTLENLETMLAGAQMQMEVWGEAGGEEMGAYMRRMQQVQPLTETQRAQLEQIKADWEAQQNSIRSRYKRDPAAPDEPGHIQLPTPKGTLTLTRVVEGDEQGMVNMYGMGAGENPEMQKEMSELDQETVDRIRAVLTIEQRGLFAMM